MKVTQKVNEELEVHELGASPCIVGTYVYVDLSLHRHAYSQQGL